MIALDASDPWLRWDWTSSHVELITADLSEHVQLTAIAVGVGLLISLPLGVWIFKQGEVYAKKHGKLKRSG